MPKKKPARTVYKGKYFRVQKTGKRDYVERINLSGVVAILALTADGKIILTEQWREPVGKRVVALAAGLAGDERPEKLLDAAKRELEEKTGYEAKRWELLTEGPSSSGLSNEIITFFLAADAVRKKDAEVDETEKIEVHVVSPRNLSGWLKKRERAGRLIDYKIFAALHLAGDLSSRGRVARAAKTRARTKTRGSKTVKARSR